MQKTHREILLDTYEDAIQLSVIIEQEPIINSVFNSFYEERELKDLTDDEIAELINWTLKSLLSVMA